MSACAQAETLPTSRPTHLIQTPHTNQAASQTWSTAIDRQQDPIGYASTRHSKVGPHSLGLCLHGGSRPEGLHVVHRGIPPFREFQNPQLGMPATYQLLTTESSRPSRGNSSFSNTWLKGPCPRSCVRPRQHQQHKEGQVHTTG